MSTKWDTPIDLHLLNHDRTSYYRPWWMHLCCIRSELAALIKPHLRSAVWGNVYLDTDPERPGAAPYEPSNYRKLKNYRCFYARSPDDVRTYAIGEKRLDAPLICPKCGGMFGHVNIKKAFVLESDWQVRRVGFQNGFALLVDEKIFRRIDKSILKSLEVHEIPVVSIDDLSEELQREITASARKLDRTLKRIDERS